MFSIVSRLRRPIRFGMVGLSGVVVNSAILWALVQEAHLAVLLASVVATEAAILSNFLLNDRWTFRGQASQRSLLHRLMRFNGVALGGMAITAGALAALTAYSHLHLLLANMLAVGAAMAWNYIVNSRWTWNSVHVRRNIVPGDEYRVTNAASYSAPDTRHSTPALEEVAA